MDQTNKLQQKWQGTALGEALREIRRLHEALAAQSGQEQERNRRRIAELVRGLRQGGIYGKYDPHRGFVEEPGAKPPRRTKP